MFTMSDLLEIAVKMEKNGEAIYSRARGNVNNHRLRELLTWMASEEENHGNWFKEKQAGVCPDENEKKLKTMVSGAFEEMMGKKTLSLDEVNFSTITTLSGMLRTFKGFEEDTILFYELLEIYIDDQETLKGLKSIIQEEKRHVEKLDEMIRAIENREITEEPVSL